jgi:hypothetical protein
MARVVPVEVVASMAAELLYSTHSRCLLDGHPSIVQYVAWMYLSLAPDRRSPSTPTDVAVVVLELGSVSGVQTRVVIQLLGVLACLCVHRLVVHPHMCSPQRSRPLPVLVVDERLSVLVVEG